MADIRIPGGIAIAVLLCSCATNRLHSDLRGIVVRVEPDSVPFVRTPDIVKFTVNVIIRNDRSTPIYYENCGGPEAQQQINGKWETVWSPACMSPTGGSVAARDSVTFPFTAAAFPNQQNLYPRLDPKASAGRYRLRLGSAYDRPSSHGTIYRGPPPPKRVWLGDLTSPTFIVYSP
jgi:hypothetical protein